ncbi:MAG: integrase arm-type DNA-binding domain-containing protein [Rhodoferax sp.]|nr:integrase arm-type DNA-binding domain-containing protein [Rhodoferax sp.]
MPRRVAPLTDLKVRSAKKREKAYKLADGGGLYLEVTPAGAKLWRLKYRQLNGKENKLHFGAYPDVSLVAARERRDAARTLLGAGIDPGQARDAEAQKARAISENTFEKIAREWHGKMIKSWQPQTAENILHRFELDLFPVFGGVPIAEVKVADVLKAIRMVEGRGALEVAKRLTSDCSRVFKYAIRCELTERNPAALLGEVLEPREKGHFAAIGADELPKFLKTLYANEACMGMPVRIAMRLMLLVFVRTSELIETPWSEIDLEKGEWIIPWTRMKRGKRKIKPDKTDHQVCLSAQALALLRELHRLTGGGMLLFPNMRHPQRPMSNMALLKALERMGYKGDMTGHGFRALAMSTLKERLGIRHEVVDRQLAHAPKDKLESAYDRARYLDERKAMMQKWADYIDSIQID